MVIFSKICFVNAATFLVYCVCYNRP